MRLKIEFTSNSEIVPFDYVTKLNGYLHSILGVNNEYHDAISIYSTSFLFGGKVLPNNKGIVFKNGAYWFISSPDNKFIMKILTNIISVENFAYGMKLNSINVVRDNLVINDTGEYSFRTITPILLKERNKNKHYTFIDDLETTSKIMKGIILEKANKFNFKLNPNEFDLVFDLTYENKKTKLIKIKNIDNKCSVCPVILKTHNLEIVKFIKNVGIGNSTGCGFGFVA